MIPAIAFSACNWESDLYKNYVNGKNKVTRCAGLSEIILNDGTHCKKGQCEQFADAFVYELCPNDYPDCSDGICRRCSEGFVYCDGACIFPKYDGNHCGASGYCSDDESESRNFKGYECGDNQYCNDGKCVPKCGENQHLDINTNSCVENSVDACPVAGELVKCSKHMEGWLAGACVNGKCVASQCDDGYFLQDSVCHKLDIENCGFVNYKCSEYQVGWVDGDCQLIDGKYACVPNKCKEGEFHLHDGRCEKNSVNDCGDHKNGLYNSCVNTNYCINGKCKSDCSDKECDGECVDISARVEHCGDCFNSCGNSEILESLHASSADCKNSTCAAVKCDDNSHFNADNTACVEDDVDNCGEVGFKCESFIDNWESGECVEKQCVLSSCKEPFEIVDNSCIDLNNLEECCKDVPHIKNGYCSKNENGNNNGNNNSNNNSKKSPTCVITACQAGTKVVNSVCTAVYSCHKFLGIWVLDDYNINGVIWGWCNHDVYVAKKCSLGYKLENGICEKE